MDVIDITWLRASSVRVSALSAFEDELSFGCKSVRGFHGQVFLRRSPDLGIAPLLFADDVIWFEFIAESEAQWMNIRISESEPRIKVSKLNTVWFVIKGWLKIKQTQIWKMLFGVIEHITTIKTDERILFTNEILVPFPVAE